MLSGFGVFDGISIHAPLRERLLRMLYIMSQIVFQSTLPYGSDCLGLYLRSKKNISIHAPLRERFVFWLVSC